MTEALLNTVIKVQKVNNATLQKTYEGVLRKLDGDVQDVSKTISHKASMMDRAISDKYEQEGVTQEQIDAFVAKQERGLIKFTVEQQAEIEKKITEIENAEQKIIKLQQIALRKQNKK
jgi:predicted transcriptional regulator